MKALVCERFGSVHDVAVQSIPAPALADAHAVTIAVEYASVSHATGLMIAGQYQRRPPLPFVPGTEAVGRVLACGDAVTRLRPGDRVVAVADWGCFAEQVTLPEYTVYRVPDQLPPAVALPVPISYGTAYCGLVWRCALRAGETVLVLGAGAGVGLAAVEIARELGATVIACASTEAKRADALRRGASHALAPAGLAGAVKALTDGRGADVVVDPVGGELFQQALRAAAANARILSIGFASGTIPQAPVNLLLVKNLTLHGFFFGRYIGWTPANERAQHAAALQQVMATLFDWAAQGKLAPTVSATYPITGLGDALAALESRQVVGKVAIKIKETET
ncbi:NADPH:quinone oxidoreductase family protein [Cupriavidus taiwanensis]|uniref:NADPH:quinone oxidoreductase family protein n=1 Tax=Cupriavidus taiwanensis TaxID=164546 RepID=UPI000E10116D|nr:NADPH:quinone oxidoreductase family protein [Cupriavidus taiwanensis]SOY73187.1 NADPH dependend quinone reductase [Cupriavidus taiwanensis]SOY73300.1 NADPH dependend quinone reductase [Cupriavidus taiwanensis]SOY97599.1 NADPH dependend quinone reductase [Cupriavidus taiwanensis]SOZ30986.1 NADPH dependend quinone reductase [Cupriavidus taiwanensis]SOZ66977.1 NADPH dependend quinone reductase [Cupriavidus taiwanensis]